MPEKIEDMNFSFDDLFEVEQLQKLQDAFAESHGVASVITRPNGEPITVPSKFTRFCSEIIRKTEKGCWNCYRSDAELGRHNPVGPIFQPCLSGGLWDAGASISVGDKHVANWLIGQVRNEGLDLKKMEDYCDEIGADRFQFMQAFYEVPEMSVGKFSKIAHMLFLFANELSGKAYQNYILKQKMKEVEQAANALRQIEEKFQLMFENSPQPMFIAESGNMRFLEVNQAMVDHYGYSHEEFMQMSLKDLHQGTPNNGQNSEEEKSFGLFYSTKEAIHRKKNGELLEVEVSLDWLIHKGRNTIHVLINDVTEKKRAQKALKESEEKFRVLFETMPDGYYRTTPDGSFLDVNPAYVKMLGYDSREALMKVSIPDELYVKPQERNDIVSINREYNSCTEEYRLKTKDGRIIWIEDNARYIREENGNVLYHEGICRDITERKLAGEKLAYEQSLMNMLMDNLPQYIYFKDIESRFIRTNKSHALKHGFNDPSEAIGKSDFDLFANEHATQAFNDEQNIIKTGIPIINLEEKETWKNGPDTWVSTTKIPFHDKEGKIIGTMGISSDITERKLYEQKLKESEEKLSTLFGAMNEMVVLHELVFDQEGCPANYRLTDCNRAYSRITGIAREELVGKLATEVYHSEQAPFLSEYSKVALTGEPYEYTTFYPPMDKYFMVSVVSPGKNIFATVTTDITDLKNAQEDMEAKKNELENYLYIASHDLRSPMVNIQGFSQRIQKKSDYLKTILAQSTLNEELRHNLNKTINEEIPKAIDFILSNVTKMDSLINGLLQISRTGRLKMDIRKLDMDRLLKNIVSRMNYQLSSIPAHVEIHGLPDCFGDENQINQLFSNLIDNAIKYRSKNRELKIKIDGTVKFNKVIYQVNDNGIGIDKEYIQKIWDVFYRIDPTHEENGEGIGLSLARRIVDKNRGKIWVESEKGTGTTFFIELNRKEFQE